MDRRTVLTLPALCAWPALTWSAQPHHPRMFLMGDSTMASYAAERAPLAGWGNSLRTLLSHWGPVLNMAWPGSSSRSYAQTCWPTLRSRLRQGDWLLIQFGHNDATSDPARHVDAANEYTQWLSLFVRESRQMGANPVLLTPMPSYRFEQGRVVDKLSSYGDNTRRLAQTLRVPLIDLSALGARAMEQIGPTRARHWFMLSADGHDAIHLTQEGATHMAALVWADMLRQKLLGDLKPHP